MGRSRKNGWQQSQGSRQPQQGQGSWRSQANGYFADAIRAVEEGVRQEAQEELLRMQSKLEESEAEVVDLKAVIDNLNEQVRALKQQLHAKEAAAPGHVEWQFETNPGEWAGMGSELNGALTEQYKQYVRVLSPFESTFTSGSGVEEYKFDFRVMQQTNVRTQKVRAIRCRLNTPPDWTRAINLEAVEKVKQARVGRVGGATLVEAVFEHVNGDSVWWLSDEGENVLVVADLGGIVNWFQCLSVDWVHPCDDCVGLKDGRLEWDDGRAIDTCESMTVEDQSSATPILANACVDITVNFIQNCATRTFVQRLMQTSVEHGTVHNGVSTCDELAHARVVRCLRVENWPLWCKYLDCRRQIEQDLKKHDLPPGGIEPPLLPCMSEFAENHGLEAGINECYLFHGTSFSTAREIALEGFDFRLSRPGYYGQGTYFASQACKSHQYATPDGHALRTIIIARVALGDVTQATKVDPELRRPPLREGCRRCYDSVIAKPGPMPGHNRGEQTHQEFVVFDKYQAYPAYIVQYTTD